MDRFVRVAAMAILVCLATQAMAQDGSEATSQPAIGDQQACETCPESWFDWCRGYQKRMEETYGTKIGVLVNFQSQILLNGDRNEGKNRNAFSYDVELGQGVWPGGQILVNVQGGSGRGIDPLIGSILGANNDAGEPECVYLSRVYLQQDLFGERLRLALGKVDLSDFFDSNNIADCENTHFLSPSLVHNPVIPFPDKGLGAVVKAWPVDWLYLQAGASDAQAKSTETGFNTAFHGRCDWLGMFELGLTPKFGDRQGNYRFTFWYDPQPAERIDGRGVETGDMGFSFSFDQQITDKLTAFARYGFAHEDLREIEHFWSVGGEYCGLLPGRDADAVGLGVAQAIMGGPYRRANSAAGSETLFETYYRICVTEFFSLTPVFQVILNPGADADADVAVAAGIRAVISF